MEQIFPSIRRYPLIAQTDCSQEHINLFGRLAGLVINQNVQQAAELHEQRTKTRW